MATVREGRAGPGPAARLNRRDALRTLAGAAAAVGGTVLVACGTVPVPGAYTGPGSSAVNLASAVPSRPASMFSVRQGVYTIAARGAGYNVGAAGSQDDLSYYFAETSATNASWSCKVQTQQSTKAAGGNAMAGLMARDSASPGARNVCVVVTDGNGVIFQWREQDDQPETQWPMPIAIGVGAPIWVRLDKAGDLWTASYSLNGKQWENREQHTVAFRHRPYLVGLVATSHDGAHETIDVFKGLQGFTPNQYISISPPGTKGGTSGS